MFKLCFARMFLRVLACLIIYLCAFRIARRLRACKHFLPLSPSFYIMHILHYSCLCTFQRKKAPFSTCCSRRFPAAPTSDSKSPEIQCLYGFQRSFLQFAYTIWHIPNPGFSKRYDLCSEQLFIAENQLFFTARNPCFTTREASILHAQCTHFVGTFLTTTPSAANDIHSQQRVICCFIIKQTRSSCCV